MKTTKLLISELAGIISVSVGGMASMHLFVLSKVRLCRTGGWCSISAKGRKAHGEGTAEVD